eukprot:3132514-Pyramimonas_sp.AAC.1
MREKFRRYQNRVQQIAWHGCVGWKCCEHVLNILRSFEGRCLNMVRGLHKKEAGTLEEFRDRSTNRSREMFK